MIIDILQKLLLVMIIFVPLERLLPIHKQKILRPAWQTDLTYALVVVFAIAAGMTALLVAGPMVLDPIIPDKLQAGIRELPLLVQFIAIVILADIGYYWIHRMFHEVPALWHYHAVHHSIEDLDWLAGHRTHPIDHIYTRGASIVLPVSLGFAPAALTVWAVFFSWHSYLKHSNVNIPFGPLRWILASPTYHHWHHANVERAFDKNYAGQLPIMDILFGTALMDREPPEVYGTDHPVSDNWVRQLVDPFTKKYAAAKDVKTPTEIDR